MLKVVLAALAALYAGPAFAGEALLKGPPAAWVKPLAIQVPAIGDDGPAVRSLLQDQELRLGDGGEAEYVQRAFQVRTPLGLMGAGSLTLAWNPATDTLTVHHVHILRDGKVIDVLAKQDFAILRRESNLDRAMLDGVLSATLQPEGLQAGDVVDLAYTRVHVDPVMQGRIEHRLAGSTFGRLDRLRLRAVWDPKLDLAWTAGEGLEKPKVTRTAHEMEVVVDMKDVDSVKFPAGAPARFWPTRELSVSGFHGWEEVAGLMTPIFEKAAVLEPESPLRAEVARIKAASDDPKIRAGLALQLVEDKVRYLALTMGEGGYVPQTPDDTWRRRFGDCKAKSVLLATLLRELGVTAELALVDSDGGDFLAARPPGVTAFDHVIVRATIGGKVYWLDGTRLGDRNVEAVRTPPFGQALPLRVAGAQLIPLLQPPPDRPDNTLAFRIDASKGIDAPAPIHAEASMGGNMAMYFNVFAGSMGSADRDKMLKGFWKAYPWVEPTTVTLVQDTETGSARMVMDGVAKLPWLDGPGERMWVLPWAHLGSMATYKRDPPGPHDDAPFLVPGYPSYDTFRLEVKLPWKGEGFHIEGGDVDATVAGQHLVRHSTLTGEVAIVEVSTRTLAPEFPASEAQAAATKLNEIGRTGVWLRAPALYRETPEDVAALAQQTPKTASDFVNRAVRFGRGGRGDQGLADLNKAIELDPKSSYAYANRATIYMQQGRAKEAAADLAKALELDPRNYVAVQVQAMTALREGRYDEALSGFTRAADLIPHNTHAQLMRAQVYAAM
ncbi:MAG TPA: DUF3857 domain-containing protein, partial [Phenylobacterium sp.]|nr:DUF3857 domain-containing protein [Phenylobacterium sp.]